MPYPSRVKVGQTLELFMSPARVLSDSDRLRGKFVLVGVPAFVEMPNEASVNMLLGGGPLQFCTLDLIRHKVSGGKKNCFMGMKQGIPSLSN